MGASSYSRQWQVTAFTNPMALRQFLRGEYPVDLIAAQPLMLTECRDALPAAVPTAAIVGRYREAAGTSAEGREVLQYQPLPELLRELIAHHAAASAAHGSTAAPQLVGGTKVIGVYSPAGGAGSTTLALHLAGQAGLGSLRAFYLNLETWNASEAWVADREMAGELGSRDRGASWADQDSKVRGASRADQDSKVRGVSRGDQESEVRGASKANQNSRESKAGLSELLYQLKSAADPATVHIGPYCSRHPSLQADYVAPVNHMEDRLTLDPGDAAKLVQVIAGSGSYDLVVVDMDSGGLTELHLAVFEQCSSILWTQSNHPAPQLKTTQALRCAQQKWPDRFKQVAGRFSAVWRGGGGSGSSAGAGRTGGSMAWEAGLSAGGGGSGSTAGADAGALPLAWRERPIGVLPEVPEWRAGGFAAGLFSSAPYRAAVEQLLARLLRDEGGATPHAYRASGAGAAQSGSFSH